MPRLRESGGQQTGGTDVARLWIHLYMDMYMWQARTLGRLQLRIFAAHVREKEIVELIHPL